MDRTLVGSAGEALRRGGGILAAAFALSFLVNLLRLAGPMFMLLVYDRVLPSRSQETLVALFVMVVALLLAQGILDYARRRVLARFGAQFQERLERALLARAGPPDLFEAGRSKPVAGLDEVDGLRGFFHSASLIAVYDFAWAPMFAAVIFVLDPLLGWACLIALGVLLVAVPLRMALTAGREADAEAARGEAADLRGVIALSRETIRSQGMGRPVVDRWTATRAAARDRAVALKDRSAWFDTLSDVAVVLARYSVLALGAWLTLKGELTVGAMVAATFLVTRVLVPAERFATEVPRLIEAGRQWGALRRILAARPDASVAEEEGNPRARLSLANLAVRSPLTGAQILKGVTLDLPPGRMVLVTGMTGKGKTTLAEAILGLRPRSGGTILLNGVNLARRAEAGLDRAIGYVPEAPAFVPGTLAENIAGLDPDASLDAVAAAARRACLHAIISALPEGYRTRIDASGAPLSRGQRHQLALARAVYRMPPLLIYDEPDPVMTELIGDTVSKTFDALLARGGSILVLSRRRLDLPQVSAAYEIVDGRLKPIRTAAQMRGAAPVAVVGGAGTDRAARGGPRG